MNANLNAYAEIVKMAFSVLIIDDSDKIRELVIRTVVDAGLFDSYQEARDGLEGFKSIMGTIPDLVICDLEMPRMDGFKFLKMVNARPEFQDIPIIILTSSSDQASKVRGLEQGACDYITKPFDAAELVARVKIHLKIKKLQEQLRKTINQKKTIEHFRALSNMDSLTKLCNRRFFLEICENEMQRAKRLRTFFSLIILDIDHFKEINDAYGHEYGDRVLVAVSETLLGVLRRYDFASRYGGDEFVLLLPAIPLSGGMDVAERLLESVQALTFAPPLERLSVTASLGVATYPSPQVDSVTTLFRQADDALYRAKQNGRNRVATMEILNF